MMSQKILARSDNDLLVRDRRGLYLTLSDVKIVEGPSYLAPRSFTGKITNIHSNPSKALDRFNSK